MKMNGKAVPSLREMGDHIPGIWQFLMALGCNGTNALQRHISAKGRGA